MILSGYFDESYDKDIFTLCCSISDSVGWADIVSGWRACLRAKNKALLREGRKPIARYHASHANARDHEFKGWSKTERDELAIKLLNTLHRGRAWIDTVSYSLPLQEFVRQFEIEGDPLPYCYRELVKFVMLEMANQVFDAKKQGPLKEIRYLLFHERCSYDDDYIKGFNSLMHDPTFKGKHLFSTIAPLGWEDCIPLQPADVLAYETFKDASRQFNDKSRRASLNCLLKSGMFGGRSKRMTAVNLTEWRAIIDKSAEKKKV